MFNHLLAGVVVEGDLVSNTICAANLGARGACQLRGARQLETSRPGSKPVARGAGETSDDAWFRLCHFGITTCWLVAAPKLTNFTHEHSMST
jgi:hypothetical protein